MPIRIEEGKTPKGERCMVAHVSGYVDLAQAEEMGRLLAPGQLFHHALVLNLIDKNTEYSTESRKYFGNMKGNYQRMASVVPSPILRAAINFMLRLSRGAPNFQMFSSEREALAWLDQSAS